MFLFSFMQLFGLKTLQKELKSIISVCILLVLIRVALLLSFVWQSSFIDVSCVLKTI